MNEIMGDEEKFNWLEEIFKEEVKGYYEYNRESPNALYVDEKENAIDSLETALSFFDREDNLKWKWVVIALHHSLYSFCIGSLEQGNYEQVLSKGRDDDKEVYVRCGNDKPRKSRVVPFLIKKYKTPAYRIEWDEVEKFPELEATRGKKKRNKEKLISFWTALARVQDDYYWMKRFVHSKAVKISDEELESICWMSEKVRNDLTHFIPKSYGIGILSIIEAARVVLKVIEFLVFESHTILFLNYEQSQRRIREAIDKIRLKLRVEEEIIHLKKFKLKQINRK